MPLDPGSPRPTSISVFGLGYVGCVSAACFAERGHSVAGVNPVKAGFLRVGRAPVAEERIGELTASEDVGTREPAVVAATERAVDRTVIDLVRRPDAAVRRTGPRYTGVAW